MAMDLDQLLQDAKGMIADATSPDALENTRVELLGKKGRLTDALKNATR